MANNLNEPYDDDDDIDSRVSVVNHFIAVCKKDLLEGIEMNR